MFVRFQERKSDGHEPGIVSARHMCAGRCPKVPGKRRGQFRARWGCQMSPRCRWRIGVEQGVELQPYRLLVSLIETRRVKGKVRQEHIANLGAIDGHLLSSFYAGLDPTTVNAILSGRNGTGMEAWYQASVHARNVFWRGVHQALARLANRVNGEQAAKILAAINARIPMLTADEVAALPRWEDEELLNRWKRCEQQFVKIAKSEEDSIRTYEKWIAKAREAIAIYRPAGEEVHQSVKHVQLAIMRGDREAIKQFAEAERKLAMDILKILANRIPGARRPG
jgi:hypothetical protein